MTRVIDCTNVACHWNMVCRVRVIFVVDLWLWSCYREWLGFEWRNALLHHKAPHPTNFVLRTWQGGGVVRVPCFCMSTIGQGKGVFEGVGAILGVIECLTGERPEPIASKKAENLHRE